MALSQQEISDRMEIMRLFKKLLQVVGQFIWLLLKLSKTRT